MEVCIQLSSDKSISNIDASTMCILDVIQTILLEQKREKRKMFEVMEKRQKKKMQWETQTMFEATENLAPADIALLHGDLSKQDTRIAEVGINVKNLS